MLGRNFALCHRIYLAEKYRGTLIMIWQVSGWQERTFQPRVAALAERLQPALGWTGNATHEALRLVREFLTPLMVVEAALGIWRFGADLGFTDEFFVSDGVFSHWQVWIALAAGTRAAAVWIDRLLNHGAQSREV